MGPESPQRGLQTPQLSLDTAVDVSLASGVCLIAASWGRQLICVFVRALDQVNSGLSRVALSVRVGRMKAQLWARDI